MPIRNQIEAVVNQLVTPTGFVYGTKNEINLYLDGNGIWPIVLLYPLKPIEKEQTLSYAINSKFSIYLEFLYKTQFDEFTSDNETFIEQANALQDEFLVKLSQYRASPDQSLYFKIKKGEKAMALPVYNKFDVNCTGMNLSLTLDTMNNEGYDPSSRPVI